jgi:hypothetical protein
MLLSLDLAAEKLSQGDTVAAAKILDKAAINARSAARLLDPKSTDAQLLMVFAQNMESRSKLYQSSSTNDTMRVVPHLSGSAHNAEELAQRLDKQGMNSDARLLRAIAADSFMQASIGLEGARSTKALVGEGLTNTYQQVVNASFDMKISEASTWKLWRDKSPADSLKQDKQKMEVVFSELKRTMKEHGVSLDQAWNDMLKDNSISSGRRVPGFITRHEAAVFLRDHEVTKNLLVPFADMAGGFNEGDAGAIDRAQARVVKVLRENGQWEAARAVLNAHMKEARTVEGRAEADRLNGSENREWWRAKAGEFARKELPVLLLTTAVSGGVGTGARALAMTAGLGTRVGSGVAVAAEIGAFVPVERILNEAINGKRGDWTANGLGRDYALAVAGYSAFKVVGLGWKAVRESGLGKNIIGGPKGSGEVVELVTPEGMRVKVSRRELEELATVQGSRHADAGGPVGRPKPIRISTSGSTGSTKVTSLGGTKIEPTGTSLGKDPASLLNGGRIKLKELLEIIPSGTPDIWKDFSHIKDGFKYKFSHNGIDLTIHFHGPDITAPIGSNAQSGWIVRIRIGNRYLKVDGNTTRNTNLYANETHIPLDF